MRCRHESKKHQVTERSSAGQSISCQGVRFVTHVTRPLKAANQKELVFLFFAPFPLPYRRTCYKIACYFLMALIPQAVFANPSGRIPQKDLRRTAGNITRR